MPFSRYAVTTFVSKHVINVTKVGLNDVSSEFPNSGSWLSNFGMLSILTQQYATEARPFAIQFLRKIDMSLSEYSRARSELGLLLAGQRLWSPYFRALNHVEASLSQLYQACSLSMKALDIKLFKTGDGSSIQRLNEIYNVFRHSVTDNDDPIWLTNVAIHVATAQLSYVEYEEILREYASIAEKIATCRRPEDSNPVVAQAEESAHN